MTKLWMFIAWRLPRPLVKLCAVRLGAHAGQWSGQEIPLLTFMDALERWDHTPEVTVEAGARRFETLNGPALIEAVQRLGEVPA